MGKISNWLARRFNSRVVELEQQLCYANERADNLTYTVKRLNDQIYYLSEQVSRQEKQFKELQQLVRENV